MKDDTLGIVQRDIPHILEALLSFLAEAEAFHTELENKIPPGIGYAQQQPQQQDGAKRLEDIEAARDVARAIEVVLPVLNGELPNASCGEYSTDHIVEPALRGGVGLIAKTFGDRLSVFKFPPATAKRLQSYMDL